MLRSAQTDLSARYARAESLLPHNLTSLIASPQVVPVWIPNTETFWYRNRITSGTEYVLVDAAAGTKQPAFDHARLASALARLLETDVDAADLPFVGIDLREGAVRVAVENQRIEVSLDTYVATILGPVHQGETASPDGRWTVGLKDHNLYLRDVSTDEVRQLTTDGREAYSYGVSTDAAAARVLQEQVALVIPPQVVWAPDSSGFITHRLDQREVELMHLVRSAPADGGRPQVMSYRYAVVGDEKLATADYFLFEAASGDVTEVKCEPVIMPFVPHIGYGFVWWDDASTKVFWLAPDRGDRNVVLREIDPRNGDVTVLHEESSPTQVLFGAQHFERNVRVLSSGEVLVWSDRSGWGHLYLHAPDGTISALTSGEWLTRKIVSVDEQSRRVTFTAAGRLPGSDIYLQELCSVSFDGGEITTLTSDGLDHDCRPSASGRFFVDVVSRFDVPSVSVLRDSAGNVVLELEQADPAGLYAAGWTAPERVVVKGADGVTDIYCSIYRPHDFDPARSYPLVQEVYCGPQISASPLRFPLSGGAMVAERSGAMFAALGFVLVTVDGRGTAMRSKAFMDHARLVRDAAYVADHVAAITQMAATRPWMDLERVGVFGHSGGGMASTKAILMEPDFYKVAVSSAGDQDDELYHSWWGEKFYGLADEFDYKAHANVSLVDNLKGKLFLVHGEMDDNVTPHLTMRLVDALIQANKDFDLLIVPNAEHSLLMHNAYWVRRRWDYFVRHLMGETPPSYRIADVPVDPEYLTMMFG